MEKTTDIYEILIRFDADGSVSGAHRQDAERVRDGDAVLFEKLLDPVNVSASDIESAIGKNAAIVAQIAGLEAKIAALTAENAALKVERDAAKAAMEDGA